MTETARIVVADDHELFRDGVIELLQTVDGLEVVGDCASSSDAITVCGHQKPDVLILDVEMPGPDAPSTIAAIRRCSPDTRIVVLTMHDDPALVRDLFAAGASGFLHKSAGRTELVAAVTTASRDTSSVLLSVSRETFLTMARQPAAPASGLLSERELEVLTLLAEAKSNRAIASALFISDGTVKRHLANIYNKLDASSRLDAVRRAQQEGILASLPVELSDEPQ